MNATEISFAGWLLLLASGVMIGLSKTGLPGVGFAAIPLVALVIPARLSTGVVLPMLIFGDLFAVVYYRRKAVWSHLLKLIPWAAAGIVLGYFLLKWAPGGKIWLDDLRLRRIIGAVILVLLFLNYWYLKRRPSEKEVPDYWWFAALVGLVAGVTTMMANAAGPVLIIYLLAMRLPKVEFVGTAAWYFFLLNWFKVPFSASLGFINVQSLLLNAAVLPAIAVGAVSGIWLLKYIPEKTFTAVIQVVAALAALKLLF
ncbi:MAG TPA: sulfite exporter TauE/SafE family protein [bacterium]|nr:sulfite exporter TauE/SafE family protein [bacterium]HPP11823.1 sulfite exporter TauE/SafE family protein [bacterium]